jgi:hypothetical protein
MIKRKIDDKSHCEIVLNDKSETVEVTFHEKRWIFRSPMQTFSKIYNNVDEIPAIIDSLIKIYLSIRDGEQLC